MANQEVSSHSANDGIQQVQKESLPSERPNCIDEPQHSTDREDPPQRQNRKSGGGLRLDDTQGAKNRQQNPEYEKPAPGFPDLLEAGDEEISNSSHCPSPFAYCRLDWVLPRGSAVESILTVEKLPEPS